MQYPYMSPQIPYYPGMASQPSALQYAQAAFLSSAMMQQLQQSSSSPLGPRSLGQTGNASAHNSINALDLSDLENSEVFAANIHRDFNAIQRQQHDIANDFAVRYVISSNTVLANLKPVCKKAPLDKIEIEFGHITFGIYLIVSKSVKPK